MSPAAARRRARILIVEDDPVIASVEEWRLKQMGYEVCGHASSGADALVLIGAKQPDLVLLDINLEGEMDGIDLGRILDTQTDIPFIFLTAHAEESILRRVKGTLQYGYIKKPFSDDDLRIAIDLALARSRFVNRMLATNALYETALDQFPLGVLIAGADGVVRFVNRQAREIMRWDDLPVGSHISELLTLADGASGQPLEDPWTRACTGRSTIWLPNGAVLRTEAGEVPIAGNAAPLFDEHGTLQGMVVTLSSPRGDRAYLRARRPG
jgi:CheY-like chemotaxis protein